MKRKAEAPMNVSSIVVTAVPERVDEVSCRLRESGLCEVFLQDSSGRIIVTIEGRDVGEEMRKLTRIQQMEHVVSADLVYSYSEHEVMNDLGRFDGRADPVPDELKSGRPESC